MAVSALQKWCDVYDIEGINWKKIRRFMQEPNSSHEDRLYRMDELRKMLDAADLRLKAEILTMLSSGMRIGALPELRLKHLKKLDNDIYMVTVYASSKKDRHITFTTPEASHAIDNYLEWRKARGETITPDSPVFRRSFADKNANKVEFTTRAAMILYLRELLVNLGIRKVGHSEVSLTHSFRKIANTAFVKAGVKPVVCEMLLGHNIGLQANYLRLSEEELLQEYVKAVPLLTVSQEASLRMEVEGLKIRAGSIDDLREAMIRLLDMKSKGMTAEEKKVMEKIRAVARGK